MIRCVCLTGGGHARVIIDAIRALPTLRIVAVLDDDPQRLGDRVGGVPVVGHIDDLGSFAGNGISGFVVGLGGTDRAGGSQQRADLYDRAVAAGLLPVTVVHPAAIVSPDAAIDEGAVVLARAIINPGAHVGANAIVNSGAIVEHDVVIGAHAHVAPGAIVCGGAQVETRSHVGAGAVVRQCSRVGVGSIVGAGAVVLDEVADGATAVGVPARTLASVYASDAS